MATPGQDIETFLERHETAQGRRLDVAIQFAESMLRELGRGRRGVGGGAAKLRRLKRETARPCPN